MLPLPKKLVLDYDKWICGQGFVQEAIVGNFQGEGDTALLNEEGYMCCLGQFYEQVGVDKDKLLGEGTPDDLDYDVEALTYRDEVNILYNSQLASDAITINDNVKTTIQEKVIFLRELFADTGFEIEFINFPPHILV